MAMACHLGMGQSLTPCQDCDTIPGRYGRYYYTEWYDSCESFLNPIGADSCYKHQFVTYSNPGMIRKWFHTDSTLQIIGLTALVDIYAGGMHFGDTTKAPEYLYLLQSDDKLCLVTLDSARWDTAKPHYMRLPSDYMDTSAYYCYAYEAFFDTPITVHGDFYIYGSINSNTYTHSSVVCDHIPTYYAVMRDHITVLNEYCPTPASFCNPASGTQRVDFYGWNHDTCVMKDYMWWGYYFPIVDAPRLDALTDSLPMGHTSGSGYYNNNSIATISAVPHAGFRFSHWNDGDTNNPRIITVTQDSTFTAYFEALPTFLLTLASAQPSMGHVTGAGTCYQGQAASIEAVAVEGFRFSQWNDGNTVNPRIITVTQDTTFIAYFEALTPYHLGLSSAQPSMGHVTGAGTYYEGQPATMEAVPEEGYRFTQWNDGISDNPRTITMTQDTIFVAYFDLPEPYRLDLFSAQPSMGHVSGAGAYQEGQVATIAAIPETGCRFAHWNDGISDNPRTITITQDTTFTAYFQMLPLYYLSLSSNNPAWGDAQPSGYYYASTPVSILAYKIDSLATFERWSDGSEENPREVILVCDTAFTAIFSLDDTSLSAINYAQPLDDVAIWPNPAHDRLTVSVAEDGLYLMELYDQRGLLLRRDSFSGAQGRINLEMLPIGHYLLRIIALSSGKSKVLSFVKN